MTSSSEVPTLIGFGVNYFQNMGPATKVSLPCGENTSVNAFKLEQGSGAPWEENDDTVIQIDCTASATMFLTSSGKIYTSGTLHGRVESPASHTIIPLPLKCVEISCGRHFGLARMEGGLAVCSWGAGHFGQLGLGHDSAPCVKNPTVIESLLPHHVGSPITRVCAGYWHAMALTESGQLYSWGCNRNSQCGIKPAKDPPTLTVPQLVRFDQTVQPKVVKLAAGRSHSVALDERGGVYCWGACNYGQCGPVGRRRGGTAPPKQVEALSQVQIVDIAAGDAHTLSLTGGGRVFGWGGGFEGQLGIGSIIQLNPKPKLVADLDFVAIEAGKEYKKQQKGLDASPLPAGAKHHLSSVPKVVSIWATGNSSLATSSDGHVYVWGCNDVQNLGIPKPPVSELIYSEPGLAPPKNSPLRQRHTHSFDSSHNIALPQRIDCLQGMNVTSVAASPTFLWCMGTLRPQDESAGVVEEVNQQMASKSPKTTKLAVSSSSTNEEKVDEPIQSTTKDPPGTEPFDVGDVGERTVDESFDEGSTSRHSMGRISSNDNISINKLQPEKSTNSLENSMGSLNYDDASNKAKKIFPSKSFKKNIAKLARRATLGAFGSKSTSEEFEEAKAVKGPKMKRRSFFGN